MFETGVRQFRMAMGIVWGRRINPQNVSRLVEDALATLAEFGEPGVDAQALTDGPLTDPKARLHFATTNVRRTAKRLAVESPFYARRFAAAEIDPSKLELAGLNAIPLTVKADLIRQQEDFRCADSHGYLTTRTTGTTGRPAEIWLSRYEVDLWSGIGALAAVLRQDLRSTDVMQVNVSSRATASVQLNVAVCRMIGTGCRVLGIVPPDEALDSLCQREVTLLATVPSYLGQLVVAARRRGLGPADFQLRRIDVGGEVLSPSLAAAARETFGVELVSDNYAMTEVIPVVGRPCSQGHLHHDINTGLVEFLDLETAEPAAPGALATTVITPYFPYRECMPVFRYDTRDVVRRLADDELTCEISGLPGTTKVLGKADHLLRLGGADVVTPRQLVEAIEALPSRPWPVRFSARIEAGRVMLTLPKSALEGLTETEAIQFFAERGVDSVLTLAPDEEAVMLRPLRCDLRETTFVSRPELIGA